MRPVVLNQPDICLNCGHRHYSQETADGCKAKMRAQAAARNKHLEGRLRQVERWIEIVEHRRNGLTLRQIGELQGVSAKRVSKIFNKAKRVVEWREQHRGAP